MPFQNIALFSHVFRHNTILAQQIFPSPFTPTTRLCLCVSLPKIFRYAQHWLCSIFRPLPAHDTPFYLFSPRSTSLYTPQSNSPTPHHRFLANMSVVKLKATPKWMPDDTLDHCPICRSSFTFFFRRHHCRICGGLVCSLCSEQTYVLSLCGTSPQRVCDLCDKAVRTQRQGDEFEQLDDHLEKISNFIHLNIRSQQPLEVVKSVNPLAVKSPQTISPAPTPQQQSQDQQQQVTAPIPTKSANQQRPVGIDGVEVDPELADSGSVVGSVQSTGSVMIAASIDDDDCVVTTTATPNNHSGSKLTHFMDDLMQPETQPSQSYSTPSKSSPQPPTTPATPSQPIAPPKELSLTISADSTENDPKSTEVRTPLSCRELNLSLNPAETPSGKKAQQRAEYGSLQRSLTRPNQSGAPSGSSTLMSSSAKGKLTTLKRNQLNSLISKAQFTSFAQEVSKEQTAGTDALDVDALLDKTSPTAQAGLISSPEENQTPMVQIVDGPNVDIIPPTSPTHQAAITDPSTPSSSSSSSSKYNTMNMLSAGRYTLVDLFNCLWSKNPPLIIDTRDTIRYNISHVPFAINIPIHTEDIDFESNMLKPTLGNLNDRVPITADQRGWRMRKGRAVVIVGQGADDVDIQKPPQTVTESSTLQDYTANDPSNPTIGATLPSVPSASDIQSIMGEYDTEPHFVPALFASALLKESSVSSVDIVPYGALAFVNRYPFLTCSSMNGRDPAASLLQLDKKDQRHNHIPRFPAFPNEIIDHCVFLGSQSDSSQKAQLEKLNITHIINTTSDLPNVFEDEVIEVTDPNTGQIVTQPLFRYLRISIDDTHEQSLLEQFNTVFDFIDKALAGETLAGYNTAPGTPGKVFVHCQMGISRSVSIVVAYVMRAYKCSLYNALAMVKSRRQQALPNPTFIKELAHFECLLFDYSFEQSSYQKCIDELYPNMKK